MNNLELSKHAVKFSLQHLSKVAVATAVLVSCVSSAHGAVVADLATPLNIVSGGTLNMGDGAATMAGALSITHNAVISRAPDTAAQATQIASIAGWLTIGYNGGLWNGVGINSGMVAADAAVNGVMGVMLYDNNQLGYTNFEGVVGLDSDPLFNQVFLRATYAGDYDASGTIDGGDYGLLDFYLGSALIAQGDINFDGAVDGGDYGLVDFVLGSQVYGDLGSSIAGPGPLPQSGAMAVPEPASGVLLIIGAAFCMARRKVRTS